MRSQDRNDNQKEEKNNQQQHQWHSNKCQKSENILMVFFVRLLLLPLPLSKEREKFSKTFITLIFLCHFHYYYIRLCIFLAEKNQFLNIHKFRSLFTQFVCISTNKTHYPINSLTINHKEKRKKKHCASLCMSILRSIKWKRELKWKW